MMSGLESNSLTIGGVKALLQIALCHFKKIPEKNECQIVHFRTEVIFMGSNE